MRALNVRGSLSSVSIKVATASLALLLTSSQCQALGFWGGFGLGVLTGAATVAGGPLWIVSGGAAAIGEGLIAVSAYVPPTPITGGSYFAEANWQLTVPTLSSDPNASAQLNNASFALISDGTSLVQFSLDIADTKGRLAAAIAAGDATSTANQQLWLSQFQTLFNNELTSLKYDMQTYSSLLAVEYPAFYNYTVTPDQVESVLSQEASGTFDSALQLALTDWQINGNLLNEVEAGFGSLSPSDIQAAGSMTTGGALTLLTDQLSELTVPEPTSMTLLAVGALALGLMMRVGRSSK